MAGKTLFLILSDDHDMLAALVAGAEAEGRPIALAEVDYNQHVRPDFDGRPVIVPMAVLGPADIDGIYDAMHAWQRGLTAQRLATGETVAAGSSPPGYPEAVAGWLLRFAPHFHLRLRLITYLTRLLEQERPALVCPVGHRIGDPWIEAVVEGVLAQRFPDISLTAPAALLPPRESWAVHRRALAQIDEAHLAGINRQMDRVSGFLRGQEKALRRVGDIDAEGRNQRPVGLPAIMLYHHLTQPETIAAIDQQSDEAVVAAAELRDLAKLERTLRKIRERQEKEGRDAAKFERMQRKTRELHEKAIRDTARAVKERDQAERERAAAVERRAVTFRELVTAERRLEKLQGRRAALSLMRRAPGALLRRLRRLTGAD